MDRKSIGIIDSGLGGLTVMKEVIKTLPNESIIYFGDNGRAPYGNKSRSEIIKFSLQAIDFIKSKDIKVIVLACNTISAHAYEEIIQITNLPVFETIAPATKVAIQSTQNNNVGIIATESTVKSNKYYIELKKQVENINVYQKACPLFVKCIEEGWWEDEKVKEIASEYLLEFEDKEIDTLVLGCTHYPVLEDLIKSVTKINIKIVNPAIELTDRVSTFLKNSNLYTPDKAANYRFYSSGDILTFTKLGSLILGTNLDGVEHVELS